MRLTGPAQTPRSADRSRVPFLGMDLPDNAPFDPPRDRLYGGYQPWLSERAGDRHPPKRRQSPRPTQRTTTSRAPERTAARARARRAACHRS
jgi:hypothetical protein